MKNYPTPNYKITICVLCKKKYTRGYEIRNYRFTSHAHLERWKQKWFCALGIDTLEIIEDKTTENNSEPIQTTQPMKKMNAKYKGKCNTCSTTINAGDEIGYDTQLRKAICSGCLKMQTEKEQDSLASYIDAAESAYYDQWYERNANANEEGFSNWNTH